MLFSNLNLLITSSIALSETAIIIKSASKSSFPISFLEEIQVNFKVNEKMLIYKNVSYEEKIQQNVSLMNELKEQKADYSNLSSNNIDRISELLEISTDKIPKFKDKKDLNTFLYKHLQKFKQ